jgi:hypothetical protein
MPLSTIFQLYSGGGPPLKKLYLYLQMNKEIFSSDAVFFKSVPNNILKAVCCIRIIIFAIDWVSFVVKKNNTLVILNIMDRRGGQQEFSISFPS